MLLSGSNAKKGGKQMTWYLLLRRQLLRGVLGCVLVSAATVAFGQTAVVPPGGSVTINSLSWSGNGCPPGTVVGNISGDNESFTLAFSEYTAEIGPGVSRRDRRKICMILVDLDIPAGFQYSVVDVDYRGFADLDEFVQGQPNSVRNIHFFDGPFFDNYEERDTFATLTYSQCGGGRTLVFDTEVAVRRLSGSATDAGGAMTVDNITGTFDTRYAIVWREC
jgi:hypothetical protein